MPEFAILDPALMRVPAENARQTGPGDVDQLIASIKEHGVLVPLTVIQRAGWYDVIDGQRRMTAAIAAGVDRVPCLVHAEGEIRAAEAGVAINAVRQALSAENIAQAAGYVLTKLGFDLKDVAGRAMAKKSAAKLRAMPEIVKAAAGCGIDLDRFLTYGILSTLESEWWDKLSLARCNIDDLQRAITISAEDRKTVIEAAGDGWLDHRHWALISYEPVRSSFYKKHAIFKKTSDLEEVSDLFGGTGQLTFEAGKIFEKRQREALNELADALKLQLPDAEIVVTDEEDSKPPKGYDYGRAFPVKGVGEKLVEQVLGMVPHLVVEGRPLLIRLSLSDSGEVWGRAFPEKERRAGDDSFALSSKGNEELLKMVHAPLLAAILKDPSPFVALAAAMPKISDYGDPCYVRADEPLSTSYRNDWAQPFRKTPIPVTVAEIMRNPMPTTVLKHMAAQLVRHLNVHQPKSVDWTLGFRHILYIYDIDPAKLPPTIAFLSTLPAAWLDEQVKRLEIKKAGGSRAKKAAAIVDQLTGTDWWPAWLADYRPLCVDQMCGIPNKIEEEQEYVDPAAQPEVAAAHVGDTPGGHTGHGTVEDETDW